MVLCTVSPPGTPDADSVAETTVQWGREPSVDSRAHPLTTGLAVIGSEGGGAGTISGPLMAYCGYSRPARPLLVGDPPPFPSVILCPHTRAPAPYGKRRIGLGMCVQSSDKHYNMMIA